MGNKNQKEKLPEMQRLSYDMTPLQEIKVPIIWLVGAPGSGRDTQCGIIEDFYGFDVIKISNLLRQHSSNETDRGRVIKENLDKRNKKIPDTIVLDIIKEEMLTRAQWSCGYLLSGFPRNQTQADMFVEEIGMVDVIIHLTCKSEVMISRSMFKNETKKLDDVKDDILIYQHFVLHGIHRYNAKVEKFDTSKIPPDSIFPRIQSAIDVRVYTEGNQREHPATALRNLGND